MAALKKSAQRLGIAWMILVLAVGIHVTDEALTGFLSVYNPTVLELRRRIPWLRAPIFTFDSWLSGLIAGLLLAFFLTPLAFRFPRAFRPIAMVFAILMILNGCSHLVGTILGHTFADIPFPRPMPGTYSSPSMIAAAVYLLIQTSPKADAGRAPREAESS